MAGSCQLKPAVSRGSLLPSPGPSGQLRSLLPGRSLVSSWRWLLIWSLEKSIRHPREELPVGFGTRGRGRVLSSHTATGLAFWGVLGVLRRAAPGSIPDRADLLAEHTLPKGSRGAQVTDLVLLGRGGLSVSERRVAQSCSLPTPLATEEATPCISTQMPSPLSWCPGRNQRGFCPGSEVQKRLLGPLALKHGARLAGSHQDHCAILFWDPLPASSAPPPWDRGGQRGGGSDRGSSDGLQKVHTPWKQLVIPCGHVHWRNL